MAPWAEQGKPQGGGCGSGSCGCGGGEAKEPASVNEALESYVTDDTYLGDLTQWIAPPPHAPAASLQKLARREFLRQLLIGGIAGIGLAQNIACKPDQRAEMVQQHYYRLSPKDRKEVIARLEREYWSKYRKNAKISMKPAKKGVLFGYALDLSLCIGCRKCVYACAEENNLSRDPQIHWIKVLQMDAGHGLDLHHGTPFYNPEKVPEAGKTYVPVACQQCADPPCTKICPVGATWREPDGITVIDYNWCIGCRYCMAACPYDARAFNWAEPSIPANQLNTDMHYLGNRPRMKGVVDKCTFCIQRVRENRLPACVESCPVGARKFGDLNDPNGELQYILKKKKVLVLKEELNTKPQFFYYY
ncbi:MAG: 4Fe-4S dicluster domain-containing protein [Myxococcales bacterium]|nr:4Fe-4S dicluster domain-containing protein [Myxococcales bacterium]MCB9641823.1 4Fe-4S dicluster domain-containing protein [Myxococcales bacterium]